MMKSIVETQMTGPSGDASPELTDEQLLLRYREEQDLGAFDELVHRYERELFSYLRRYLGDAAMAEDAFQATFLQLHLKRHQYEIGRKVRPWLYTIATHQAIDAQRRNKRHRMVSLDRYKHRVNDDMGPLLEVLITADPGPLPQMETAERRDWVRHAVASLPEQLRSAVLLVYYQGLKYREAAEVLAIPVGTVKSRLHAALLKLSEAWDESNVAEEEDG